MKKEKLLAVGLIFILSFYSCSNDDDNSENESQNYSELIVGEWSYTSQTLNGNDLAFEDECQQNYEHQIYSSNGNYEQTEFENLSGSECEQVSSSTGNWDIDESILNLSQGDDVYELEILTLNNATLKYKASIDYDEDGIIDEFIQTLSKVN